MLRGWLSAGFGLLVGAAPALGQGYGYWPPPPMMPPPAYAPYGQPMPQWVPPPAAPWQQVQQAGMMYFPPLPDLRRVPPQPTPVTPPSLPYLPPVQPRQAPPPSPKIDTALPMPERIPFAVPEAAPPSAPIANTKPSRGWAKPTAEGPALSAKPSARVVVARPASRTTQGELPDLAPPPSVPLAPVMTLDGAANEPTPRWYGRGEYLYWWTANQQTGPLAVLGYPDGRVETIGGSLDLGSQGRSGGRFSLGRWLGEEQVLALETDFFFLGQRSGSRDATAPSIGLPFIDANGNGQNAPVAAPGGPPGSYRVSAETNFWGLDLVTRAPIARSEIWRLDGIIGARYLHLGETLQSDSRSITPGGDPRFVSDRFETSNDYWLAQLGVDAKVRMGRAFLQGTARFGLGVDVQTANLTGSTNGVPGGFLVQGSNAGGRSRSEFAWVPEFGVRTGADLTRNLRATVGYTFLLLPNAVRPGDAMDPVQGGGRPTFTFGESPFWAQGINGGLEFRW